MLRRGYRRFGRVRPSVFAVVVASALLLTGCIQLPFASTPGAGEESAEPGDDLPVHDSEDAGETAALRGSEVGGEANVTVALDDGWGTLLPGLESKVFPALLDDEGQLLIRGATTDGMSLFALDATSGQVNWRIDAGATLCVAITESGRTVALASEGDSHTVWILDPATGEVLATTPTVIEGCDHAAASGEMVIFSHGTNVFGFNANDDVIAFESGLPGQVSPAVVSGDGRVWATAEADGEAHAVEFLLPSGDVDVQLLPVTDTFNNVEPREDGFTVGYRDDEGDSGLLRYSPATSERLSGPHPTPLPNLFDGEEFGGEIAEALSTDGELVAGYLDPQTVGVFDVMTGEPLKLIRPSAGHGGNGELFLDQGLVHVGPADGAAWVETYDARSGELLWDSGPAGALAPGLRSAEQFGPATADGAVVFQAPMTGGIAVAVFTPEAG